jgi:histidinol-phosphatase (PHP family)
MACTAEEKGFNTLGFSGHGYLPVDTASMSVEGTRKYIAEVRQLKQEYKGRMNIFLGIEQDMLNRMIVKEPFEFVIGSCHFLTFEGKSLPIDYNRGVLEMMNECWYDGDFRQLAKAYYAEIRKMKDWEEVDIIGHLDLITKYNEDESFISFNDPEYIREACDTVDALNDRIFEINTGAIARGTRKTPYPHISLLKYMREKGVKICLNSDCHDRRYLDCYYPEALEMVRRCGFTSMSVLTEDGFREEDISRFI